LRTAYLGTSEFAASVLRRLAASKHRPALVVTPPDRPQGRGRKVAPPPAAETAKELGLELAQFESVNDEAALERIRAARSEVVVVCAFGQLIKEPLLSEVPMINVHPSLIPRWRGAAPIERAMMAGDERTGVTIMRLTEGLDSGPVALQEEIAIEPGEDFPSLSGRLAELGGELVVAALDGLEKGRLEFSDQDDDGATYAEKIDRSERRLDPARPAIELERIVRALAGRVGAYIQLEERKRLGVEAATATQAGPAQGEIAAEEGELVLGTPDGGLRIDTVKPPGGRAMSAKKFLRGHEPPGRAV
jgi:methionyl-tRNA formyltransferase